MQLTIDLIQGTQLARVPRPDAALMNELRGGAPLSLEALWLRQDGEHPVFTVRVAAEDLLHEAGDLLRVEGLEPLGAQQGDRLTLWAGRRHVGQERWWGTASLLLADAQIVDAMVHRARAPLQARLVPHLNLSLAEQPRALSLSAFKERRDQWRRVRAAVEGELVRFEQSVMRPLRSLERLEQRLGVPVRLSLGPQPEGPPPSAGGGSPSQDPDPDLYDRVQIAQPSERLSDVISALRRFPRPQGDSQERDALDEPWLETFDPQRRSPSIRSLPVRPRRRHLTDSQPELERLLEHLERALGESGTLTPVALLGPPAPEGETR
ncbi:MAG: hypothetical protein H6741_10755 [Alphaproteobacteria bacterium]|nr:hypothetical protein [Alphaproteobacteria bacterium]